MARTNDPGSGCLQTAAPFITVPNLPSAVSPYLETCDLRVKYETSETPVLDGIGFRVNEGEVVSLLGPSGCGKTTLFNVLSGLHIPTSGEVKLRGESVIGSRQHTAYLFQDHSLLPWRNVLQNVLLPAELEPDYRSPEIQAKCKQEALELLAAFGLEATVRLYPAELSGGMKQRAALARAFMADRPLYLFDEPFTGLDFFRRLQVEKMLSNYLRSHRRTCLLITHDLETALAISHRIFLLSGTPCTIRKEIGGLAGVASDPIEARKRPEFEEAVKNATVILTDIFETYASD